MSERANKPSASGIPRIVFCPGSWLAEEPFRDKDETSDAAESGTAIALALESGVTEFLDLTEKQIHDKLAQATEEICNAWLAGMDALEGPAPPRETFREERFWIRDSHLQPITSAKPDFLTVCGTRALLIDDKTGFKDLSPAEEDWQIRCQVVAVKENFPQVTEIVAGLLHHRFRTKWDPVLYKEEAMNWARIDLMTYLHRAEDQSSPRVPGNHCRYCKARGICAEAQTWSVIPMHKVSVLNAPNWLSAKDRKAAIADAVATATIEDLAFIKSRKTLAEELFSAAEAKLKSMPAEVLAEVGLELVPNAPMRNIDDIQACYSALASANLINDEEFRALCKVGITPLEELVVPRIQAMDPGLKLTQDEAKKLLSKLLLNVIKLVPKAASLKPLRKSK